VLIKASGSFFLKEKLDASELKRYDALIQLSDQYFLVDKGQGALFFYL
jgi:hypothetical protein